MQIEYAITSNINIQKAGNFPDSNLRINFIYCLTVIYFKLVGLISKIET